eukprot:m.53297 g.53297  ORF g.53297 m.53297 type:complete len:125 (+) comp7659_c0_seq1:258-632(+)
MTYKGQLKSVLGLEARIEIKDGRVFFGSFMCVDKKRNIILQHVVEKKPIDGKLETRRNISLIMVPGDHIISFKVQRGALSTPTHIGDDSEVLSLGIEVIGLDAEKSVRDGDQPTSESAAKTTSQ